MLLQRPLLQTSANLLKSTRSAHRPTLLTTTTTTTTTPTSTSTLTNHHQRRPLHARIPAPPIPSPTPFVPDAPTFLTLIGRKLSTHSSKFPSWDSLFTLTSPQLKNLGVEPARARRYLLRWRDKFRNGEFGVGGDAEFARDGRAEVRVVEVDVGKVKGSGSGGHVKGPRATVTRAQGTVKRIVNVDPEAGGSAVAAAAAKKVEGLHLKAGSRIYGSHVEPVKGTSGKVAVLRVKEGMWEHRRGHKIDGGERRRAEVRAKKRAADRKAGKA